jgi:hypothetical protein
MCTTGKLSASPKEMNVAELVADDRSATRRQARGRRTSRACRCRRTGSDAEPGKSDVHRSGCLALIHGSVPSVGPCRYVIMALVWGPNVGHAELAAWSPRAPGGCRNSVVGRRPSFVVCGRSSGRCVGGVEQLSPGMAPGPVLGQVDGDAAGVAGDPAGEVDQLTPARFQYSTARPFSIFSDDTYGSILCRTEGNQSRSARATAWLASPDQLMKTFMRTQS